MTMEKICKIQTTTTKFPSIKPNTSSHFFLLRTLPRCCAMKSTVSKLLASFLLLFYPYRLFVMLVSVSSYFSFSFFSCVSLSPYIHVFIVNKQTKHYTTNKITSQQITLTTNFLIILCAFSLVSDVREKS